MSDEGPEPPGSDETGRKLSIVDAVCCVYFCAAGKSGLLVAILTGLGMEILIAEEVVAEARNKKIYGQLPTHIQRLQASTKRLQVVAEAWADATTPYRAVRDYLGR